MIRLEDAFLRSVGLGADLIRPLSWVMESRGMYYDATAPSELEHKLLITEFPADLLVRARLLRDRIVEQGLTKYNVGAGTWRRPNEALRVILVPGQVESDASIQYAVVLRHRHHPDGRWRLPDGLNARHVHKKSGRATGPPAFVR